MIHGTVRCRLHSFSSSVDIAEVIAWLVDEITIPNHINKKFRKNTEFILAALRAELLSDLLQSLDNTMLRYSKPEKQNSWWNQTKFLLLAVAGTLLAACEGFDGITSMMSVLSFSSLIILITGIVFSILSIFVFYGYDLMQVSKNLEITLSDAPKLLDIYLSQMEKIKAIRKTITSYSLASLSAQQLTEFNALLAMMQVHFKRLIQASKKFDSALNSLSIKIAKIAFSGISGLLFFGGGFFAGQSVAMFIIGLFITSVSPTFWPVVLFSVLVGLAAFSLYWYVERIGVQQLVSDWFGLNEEKIEKLCNKEYLDKEEHKLAILSEQLLSSSSLVNKVIELEELCAVANNSDAKPIPIERPLFYSKNKHLFYADSPTVLNLGSHQQDNEDNTQILSCG